MLPLKTLHNIPNFIQIFNYKEYHPKLKLRNVLSIFLRKCFLLWPTYD